MNQDQDSINGESNGQDTNRASIHYAPVPHVLPTRNGVLIAEGFEDWSQVPGQWSLETADNSTIATTSEHTPFSGSGHLLSTAFPTSGNVQALTLVVDASALAERDDLSDHLFLDFWMKRVSCTRQSLDIQFSGNCQQWWDATSSPIGVPTEYSN